VGMSNLKTFLLNTAPYRRALRVPEYGDPVKDEKALGELSAINYLSQIKGPMLLIQGVSDPRVPAGEAVQMYEKMKGLGLSPGLILFADEGHGSQKRSNQVLEIGHTLQFFRQNLH
jgi:dipeptidyl aminopeptidase/acylaminoacyl peptidase